MTSDYGQCRWCAGSIMSIEWCEDSCGYNPVAVERSIREYEAEHIGGHDSCLERFLFKEPQK